MFEKLEKTLGYTFNNADLIKQALSHRSCGKKNNERLEFLGDSLLNMMIAEALYQRFPQAMEGQLSRLRANLVRGETLAKVSMGFELGPHLLLGPGEMKSGGERRASILADTLEAIIAAIYLDSSFEVCRDRVLAWFSSYLAEVSPDNIVKDPKSTLQEYLQSRQLSLPEYELVETTGKEHKQQFKVACKVDLLTEPVEGMGSSRRRAEQQSAENVLEVLEKHGK